MLNNAKTVPSLKTKTNELFYRWLSRPERTEQLKEVINIIRTSNRIPKQTELKSYKNDYETRSTCKAFMEQLQQGLQPSALPLNSNNSNNSRSKSPPGIQSPPMSPVNRMPQSPKSPRHRTAKTPLVIMATRNNQNLLSQSSFAYASPSSPTISLLSSSSSPSSSSSSPIQFNMSKKSALTNITAAIAKHQNPKSANSKLINMIVDNNGVACSVVKSTTNIYYNLKVDAATSKAVHYCDKCTNPDCRAIHKNLTKPVLLQNSQSPMRIYLNSPSSNQKLSGANINFIFERRYPKIHDLAPPGHQRHIVIRPSQSDDLNPSPLSPQALHNAIVQAAQNDQNSSHFAINLNRVGNKTDTTKSDSDPFLLFPNLNLNSLKFKNTLFLDQERPQSPGLVKTSDEFKNNHAKIQTSTSTTQPMGQKQQPPQLLQTAGKIEPKPLLPNVDFDQVDQVSKSTRIEAKPVVSSPAQVKTPKQIKKANIPQFHFPNGRPDQKIFKNDQEAMKLVSLEFKLYKDGKLSKDDLGQVCKIIGLPKYWKSLLFNTCATASKLNHVTFSTFEQTWQKLSQQCFDRVTLFMKLIAPSASYIVYEDWEPLLQDIVDTHPGLKFLHDHKEFHTRYIKTVIARIFYVVNRSWSGRITPIELKRSNFLSILENLESEDDINLIRDYFSYEHFYVIYCKFWELDKDHDLYISKEDLFRHNNYSINPKVIDRIFSGTVIKGRDWREGLMSYYDFVWFLMSEEDKRNPTSIEYWFRVLDIDGDGILSMYELEYFYSEQMEQMRERQIEFMPFNDLLCQMLDLVKPKESGKIRLKDLKQCKMANIFFDTFVNLEKYLDYEQKDPFANIRDLDGPEQSDWDKYAAFEYENLVSEDGIGDNQEGYNNYDEDFDEEPMMFGNQNGINSN